MEKTVDAHRGACLTARWSHDGAGIATGGEDGLVQLNLCSIVEHFEIFFP